MQWHNEACRLTVRHHDAIATRITHSHLLLPVVLLLGIPFAEEDALTLARPRDWNEKTNFKKASHIEGNPNTRTGKS